MVSANDYPIKLKEPDQCKLCKDIVNIIDAEVKIGNYTIKILSGISDRLCHMIAGQRICHECDVIIENINEIVNWICEGIPTTEICHKLGFCYTSLI